VRSLAAAGAGFLLAVLWFDLMFDVQARGHRDVPAGALDSIAAYYRRVTTNARPMNRLVALAMLGTLVGLAGVIARDELPAWRGWLGLGLAVAAIGTAAARTVRNAVRLGTQADDATVQSRLARTILRDHVFCFAAMATCAALVLTP
jgi:uncharacterized membrane protein YfcA